MASKPTDDSSTTVQVAQSLHARLDELKPYRSMSYNEFLEEILDVYERQVEEADR